MFQQCIVIGRLGQDPELRTTGGGTQVANFSVACSEKWKDKQSGEMQERTEWFRCVAWGRTAEIAGEYLKKGHVVTVVGTIRTETYTDKQDVERSVQKLNINELKLMPNGDRSSGGGQREEREERPARGGSNRDEGSGRKDSPQDDLDDDIPF